MTQQECKAVLEEHFGVSMDHWENNWRWLYTLNSKTLEITYREFSNLGHDLMGAISDVDDFAIIDDRTVEFYETYQKRIGRKTREYNKVHRVIKENAATVTLMTRLEHLYDVVIDNFAQYQNTILPSVAERMGIPLAEATDEVVAEHISWQQRDYVLDVPDVELESWGAKIHVSKVNGLYRIEGTLEDGQGNIRVPQKRYWSLTPEDDIVGIPGSSKAAGEHPSGSWFVVDTDLRNRDSKVVHIMNPKDVKIKFICWAKESDGDLVRYEADTTVDMSDLLEVYDYFLLLE